MRMTLHSHPRPQIVSRHSGMPNGVLSILGGMMSGAATRHGLLSLSLKRPLRGGGLDCRLDLFGDTDD